MYRHGIRRLEVFLVHPGGPLFARKDAGYWGIPKGLADDSNEGLLSCAIREFEEETGLPPPAPESADYVDLGTVQQSRQKTVHAWAFEGDWPPGRQLVSNTFALEWPPHSGRIQNFPEIDRGEFFTVEQATVKMNRAQFSFVERLMEYLQGMS